MQGTKAASQHGRTVLKGCRTSVVASAQTTRRPGSSNINLPLPATLPAGLSSTVTNTIKALDLDTDLDDLEIRDVKVCSLCIAMPAGRHKVRATARVATSPGQKLARHLVQQCR